MMSDIIDFGRVDVVVIGSFWSAALGLAWMPERRLRMLRLRLVASRGLDVGLGCLGNMVVDPCGARPRGRRGVFSSCIFFFLGFILRSALSFSVRRMWLNSQPSKNLDVEPVCRHVGIQGIPVA